MDKLPIFKQAVQDLTQAVCSLYGGIVFDVQPKTPNNYEKLKEQFKTHGYISISNEGCDNTIYGNSFVNILARVWHDRWHLTLDLDFSLDNERKVAIKQYEECYMYLLGRIGRYRALKASMLLFIDIVAQAEYYELFEEYVDNQLQFVSNLFDDYIFYGEWRAHHKKYDDKMLQGA